MIALIDEISQDSLYQATLFAQPPRRTEISTSKAEIFTSSKDALRGDDDLLDKLLINCTAYVVF